MEIEKDDDCKNDNRKRKCQEGDMFEFGCVKKMGNGKGLEGCI